MTARKFVKWKKLNYDLVIVLLYKHSTYYTNNKSQIFNKNTRNGG